jgi:hypothetical protein
MGEQVRAGFAALRSVGIHAKFFDVFRHSERSDPDIRTLVIPHETVTLNDHPVRIFHINGDEVDAVLAALVARGMDFHAGYNIIVPAWELPKYPEAWKSKLDLFNEVWAISHFVEDSLKAVGTSSCHVGQAVEKIYPTLHGRKQFGIRESAFVLLNFFDTKSFPARKNPEAVLNLYRRIRKARPYDDIQLVLKMRDGETTAEDAAILSEIPREVRLISTNLSSQAAYSLIAACDCFASLHRAEGYGRGLAETMWLGRLALGTGWSGNTDYMRHDNSLLINYALVPVNEGEYPHSAGQFWAEPDLDHAEFLLKRALDDGKLAASLYRRARLSALMDCSNRAVGLRLLPNVNAALARECAASIGSI